MEDVFNKIALRMGQLCSKRKRKLSDHLSFPDEEVSLPLSQSLGEEIGLAKKYFEFLEKNKVTRKESFFDFFSEKKFLLISRRW